jgi:hypothetical protein
LPDLRQRVLDGIPDSEIDKAVAKVWSGQEFRREIRNDFGIRVRLRNRIHGSYVAVHHSIAHGIGESHVPVVARRVLRQLALKAMQIVDQGWGDRIRFESGSNVVRAIRLACPGL